ncbi:hypothetical protein LDENG_00077220 [Lucifuga dentata]|nr:hypothetical protein LDENG_00077220 [Lucifuga dentata]
MWNYDVGIKLSTLFLQISMQDVLWCFLGAKTCVLVCFKIAVLQCKCFYKCTFMYMAAKYVAVFASVVPRLFCMTPKQTWLLTTFLIRKAIKLGKKKKTL